MNNEVTSNFNSMTFDFIEPSFQPLEVAVATNRGLLKFDFSSMLNFIFAIKVL